MNEIQILLALLLVLAARIIYLRPKGSSIHFLVKSYSAGGDVMDPAGESYRFLEALQPISFGIII